VYKLFFDDLTGMAACIERLVDHAFVPINEGNSAFQEFMRWNMIQEVPLNLNSIVNPQQISNSNAIKKIKIKRLLNKDKIAEAIKLKGGL
jgi:hypothetical protein